MKNIVKESDSDKIFKNKNFLIIYLRDEHLIALHDNLTVDIKQPVLSQCIFILQF